MNKGFRIAFFGLLTLLAAACNPNAPWVTDNVNIYMSCRTTSAGFLEYHFETSRDAYYFIACEPARAGEDPQAHPKQFMMLALDSANVEYIKWRNWLLKQGEFNIAPFASHVLQYGAIDHFFTNLEPNTNYWIYAFVVNPETLKPAGKLYLETVITSDTSVLNIRFEYRVRGYWDYIYPLNASDGKINSHFPYLAATEDSAYIHDSDGRTPEEYFSDLFDVYAESNSPEHIRYGVQVVENDGVDSDVFFEVGHTYYTAIAAFDGRVGNSVIYKFTWEGEEYEAYFRDEDSIVSDGEDD